MEDIQYITKSLEETQTIAKQFVSFVQESSEQALVIALSGRLGAGKTTLLNMLVGLFEPSFGKIMIDDIPVSEIDRSSLSHLMAIVSQDTFIFHDTVFENIRFGLKNVTQEQIELAAKTAYAHSFIESFPMGYSTVVGDKGLTLSGGQRQRIAIARAILRNTPIIILDEATSAVDVASELEIQKGLFNLLKDKTVLVVTHRLPSVQFIDKIIVLERGQIIQEGTHKDLHKNYNHLPTAL